MKTFALILLLSCQLFSQDFNHKITDPKSGKIMLIGECNREAFADSNFAWWFNSAYEFYTPDSNITAQIKSYPYNYSIKIVMGTWCSDSRREVPRFYKLLDQLEFPIDSVKLINVNRDKKGLLNEVDNLEIELVPTLIFYFNNSEFGRIVEAPINSLEKDYLEFLEKKVLD